MHKVFLCSVAILQIEPTLDSLKLGLVGLPEAESNLIATLFRLHRVERSFIWKLRSAPPFDALLVDASAQPEDFGHLCSTSTRIMMLSAAGTQEHGNLERPIRSDRLVAWLNSIEVGLLHGGHDAFASTEASASQSATRNSAFVQTQTPIGSTTVEPVAEPTADPSMVFKLKRWPPAALLARDVRRIRTATVLSRKPISLTELANVTRIDKDLCTAFLQILIQHNLISSQQRPAPPEQPAEKIESPIHPHATKPPEKVGRSLIQSIRRRFGLT